MISCFAACRQAARGYLLKDTARAVLFDTIRAAAQGRTLLSPEVLARVLAAQGNSTAAALKTENEIALTDREMEVLQAAARGDRSKEIAPRSGYHRTHRESTSDQYLQ